MDDKERERKEEELWKAAGRGDTDRVKQLLADGVNHSAAGGLWQRTPLHKAAAGGHNGIVSALLTAGADVNARDEEQITPLHRAAWKDHHETVSALLAAGADVNARNYKQITPLHLAAQNGHHETVSALLAAGADVNARNYKQSTPLHKAAWNGHHETVSALLAAGADVNARNYKQWTPLHEAAQNGLHETVSALLTAGADVNARDYKQSTPLHKAAWNGHHETVSALLAAGADVNARNYKQWTPLYEAAQNGLHETVSALLTAGADVNARNDKQSTPLHWAARKGHHETVSALLTAGADVNARDKWDDTPLHDAATHGYPKCAEVLLQHGADTGIRNGVGQTAEDIAADGDTSVADPEDKDEEERIIRGRKDTLKLLREENNEVSERTKEYDPVLVRFYEEKGMTVAKKACPLIEEAANESGKTITQVKNFIGNYRKSKGGSKRRPPADTVERTRRITGYHEYYREQLPRKRDNRGFSLAGANKEIGESWKILTDEEKEGYNKAAERRRGEETQVKTWSEVSKKLKQLEKLSDELDNLGVESLVVTLYNGRIQTFGSQKDLAKDEGVGGFIENQLKAAELQRKAAQCLTLNRLQRNPSTEDTRGVNNEDPVEAGTSASSGKSPRKKRKKDKGSESNPQSSPTSSSPSTSSSLAGLLRRTTSIPVSHNTRTTLDALDKLEALVRHPAVFGDSHVPPGGGDPFGLPDRTTSSPNLPTVLPTSLTRGTTTLTTGGLPHTTSQIPTAPNTGPPADRQAHTNINPLVVFSTFSASPYLDTGR